MKRRQFIKDVGIGAAALAGAVAFPNVMRGAPQAKPRKKNPNILVIIVDQLRFPQAAFSQGLLDQAAPNMAMLRKMSVSFDSHFGAATACSPSRSTMLTGLYTHQNGMFLTNAQGLAGQPSTPDLNPGFPTWGSILSSLDFNYKTFWWGKWHLSSNDQVNCNYTHYGFQGNLPCPSPDGGPGQGMNKDPEIVAAFKDWLADAEQGLPSYGNNTSTRQPWCTTVSLVNPHDIQWYPKYSANVPGENNPPPIPEFHSSLPYNFEKWPEAYENEKKPRAQLAWYTLSEEVFGSMPTHNINPEFPNNWYVLLDLYYQVTQYVDQQIGEVLKAFNASSFKNDTIVIFTSDHGEYGGGHGLHGKAFAVYDEAIHVPLYVWDPTQTVVPLDQVGTTRSQMSSHVDFVPLLMTLAGGNNNWRSNPKYAHLATRANLAAMLSNPQAKGRKYILHTSDEDIPEEGPKVGFKYKDIMVQNVPIEGAQGPNPTHVVGYRTPHAKLGVYSVWNTGKTTINPNGQQAELYNYDADGSGEVSNHAPGGPNPDQTLYDQMYNALFDPTNGYYHTELRRPLPNYLKKVQQQAMKAYTSYETAIS